MAVDFSKKKKSQAPTVPAFMKKGKAAQTAMKQEEKRIQERQNMVWRFWMPEGGDTQITFVDGNLDEEGLLDCLMWHEHNLQIAGKWGNFFTCVKEEEPCPLCDNGASSLVAGLTIIDHTAYKSKKSGLIIKDQIKLFVCKQDTYKLLQKIATKRGGLAGCTFDVSRTGDRSPNVGNMFDFTEKRTLKQLQTEYGQKATKTTKELIIAPLDFGKVIDYRSADDLRKLGFGAPAIGSEDSYSDEL